MNVERNSSDKYYQLFLVLNISIPENINEGLSILVPPPLRVFSILTMHLQS